jgi:SAM-dependent methyltransferase
MSAQAHDAQYWDARFGESGYAYGTEPNDFLREVLPDLPDRSKGGGDALSLCEGEGRNAVFLARHGFRVTAVDFSAVGLAKARDFAARQGVSIETVQADLAQFDLGQNRWDLVIAIFAQPPAPVRRRLYAAMARALRANGRFVLETKAVAGADADERYPGVEILVRKLSPLRLDIAREGERLIAEGRYHTGTTRTAQILACKC